MEFARDLASLAASGASFRARKLDVRRSRLPQYEVAIRCRANRSVECTRAWIGSDLLDELAAPDRDAGRPPLVAMVVQSQGLADGFLVSTRYFSNLFNCVQWSDPRSPNTVVPRSPNLTQRKSRTGTSPRSGDRTVHVIRPFQKEIPMFDTLLATADGGVGRLTLNRPDKLNPLSTQTLMELAAAARWFDQQPRVKVVIVSGAGRAFSAGADLASFSEKQEVSTREAADRGREMADALEAMRAVSIAAIRGWCVGGGLVLAAACDLRVAAEDARFSIPEVDLGIPLAWGGIPRLVREIGPALTKELVLTCRPFDAAEAYRAGFLNRVVPGEELDATVEELAESLATKAPHTLTSTKRHVNAVTDQMVGTMRSWSDADGLVTALNDDECGEARRAYLRARSRGGR